MNQGAKVDEVKHVELERPDGEVVYAQLESFPIVDDKTRGEPKVVQVLALQRANGGPASRHRLDSDEVQRLRQRYPELDRYLSGGQQQAPDF